jgi:hypothetical protein
MSDAEEDPGTQLADSMVAKGEWPTREVCPSPKFPASRDKATMPDRPRGANHEPLGGDSLPPGTKL